jgi:hypothetical protein
MFVRQRGGCGAENRQKQVPEIRVQVAPLGWDQMKFTSQKSPQSLEPRQWTGEEKEKSTAEVATSLVLHAQFCLQILSAAVFPLLLFHWALFFSFPGEGKRKKVTQGYLDPQPGYCSLVPHSNSPSSFPYVVFSVRVWERGPKETPIHNPENLFPKPVPPRKGSTNSHVPSFFFRKRKGGMCCFDVLRTTLNRTRQRD